MALTWLVLLVAKQFVMWFRSDFEMQDSVLFVVGPCYLLATVSELRTCQRQFRRRTYIGMLQILVYYSLSLTVKNCETRSMRDTSSKGHIVQIELDQTKNTTFLYP
jgi:hypothetical protein